MTEKISVSIVHAFTKVVIEFNIMYDCDFIDVLHNGLTVGNPDCFVNFTWKPAKCEEISFISGMPENMMIDEISMSFDEYLVKWYSPK